MYILKILKILKIYWSYKLFYNEISSNVILLSFTEKQLFLLSIPGNILNQD